jgi:hypothetical protein
MTDGLDAQRLIEAACAQTGLHDLDDHTLPDRLAALTRQLETRLDADGRRLAAQTISGLLTQRLTFFEDRKRHPISAEVIERPIIAFGEGRSGTTVLQMLLGCDPNARLLEFWEVMRPSPPPGISDTAVRQSESDDDWREILDLIPRWISAHPYNAMLGRNPPECERLWTMDFRSLPPTAWWRVPVSAIYPAPPIALAPDHRRQYEIHGMMLQHLQYGAPRRRWVLKGTSHQQRLRALLEAYPDAVFVWIHRDPVQAMASLFGLLGHITESILRRPIDQRAFADSIITSSLANFRHTASDPAADDPRIYHLHYKTFTRDPVAAIHAIYAWANIPFPDTFEPRMRQWMSDNPPNRYGHFGYSADDLGVDLAALDRDLAPYRERFGVPKELTSAKSSPTN